MYAHQVASELSKYHQVIYATKSKVDQSKFPYQIANYTTYQLAGRPLPSPSLVRLTRKLQPDVFHAFGSGYHHHISSLKYFSTSLKASIFSFMAPVHPSPIISFLANAEEKFVFSQYDLITTLTSDSYFQRKFSRYSQKMFPLNPILNPLYQNQTFPNKTQLKRELSLDRDKKYILLVSKLDKHHYYKGVEVALQSFVDLDSTYQLMLVGDGELKPKYQQIAADLRIDHQVQFLGNLSHNKLNQLFRASDVFILPSTSASEGFGIVLIEAMASYTPVITTSVVGLLSEFPNQSFSTIIPPNDAPSLTKAINQSFKSPPLKKQLQSAYKFANSYNQKRLSKQLKSLYSHVIT